MSLGELEDIVNHHERIIKTIDIIGKGFVVIPPAKRFFEYLSKTLKTDVVLEKKARYVSDKVTREVKISLEARARDLSRYAIDALNLNQDSKIQTITVHLPSQDGKAMEHAGSYGELSELLERTKYHREFTNGNSLIVKSFETGKEISAIFNHKQIEDNDRERYILPINLNDSTIGVVELISERKHKITPEQKEIARKIVRYSNFSLNSDSDVDDSTGLYIQKKYWTHLNEAVSEYSRKPESTEFSIGMMDLGNFKKINDTFGHTAGSAVLRIVSDHLKTVVRGHEKLYRYGGDEFTIILKNTDFEGAIGWKNRVEKLAPELIDKVEAYLIVERAFKREDVKTITKDFYIDIGVATIAEALTSTQLTDIADDMMYKTKKDRKIKAGIPLER